MHSHLPRLWQQVSWRLESLQEHHRGPRDQGDGVGRRWALQEEAQRRGIEYHILRTEEPYIEAIEAWLGLRGKSSVTGGS